MGTRATSSHSGPYPSANIPPEVMSELHRNNELSLHVKVLYKQIKPQRLKSHFLWLWSIARKSLKGTIQVFDLGNEYFQLKFSNSLDYNMALEGNPWLIDGHYIYLRPWVPNFKPSTVVITKIKVWIILTGLPAEYYDTSVFYSIATAIGGTLIKIHPVAENKFNLRYARLCVEIDLTSPLVSYVELDDGYQQPIEYEGIHVVCYRCRLAGHLESECVTNRSNYDPRDLPLAQVDSPVSGFVAATSSSQLPVSNRVLNDNDQGSSGNESVAPSLDEQLYGDLSFIGPSPTSVALEATIPEATTTSDSSIGSHEQSPSPNRSPNPSLPFSTLDKFYIKAYEDSTKEEKLEGGQLSIVDQRCPTVIIADPEISGLDIVLCRSPLPSVNGNENEISVIPSLTDEAAASNTSENEKLIFIWNSPGLGDPKVRCAARRLRETYNLPIMVLPVSGNCWDKDVKSLRKDLGFSSSRYIDSDGFNVVILWQKDEVDIQIIADNTQSGSNLIFAAATFIRPEDWVLT